MTSHVTQLINTYLDLNLKSNQNRDKGLNEIRMINDSRYQSYLPELAFNEIAKA